MKKKLLFVRGFQLSNDSVYDEYKQIEVFFRNSKYKLEYFKYTTEEPLDKVYDRLHQTIKNGDFSILMGHSMGGALLSKFCRENDMDKFEKIVLLMPFISTNSILNNLLKLDFVQNYKFPKALILPQPHISGIDVNPFSFIISVIANDSFGLISIHQVFYAKQNLLLTEKQIIKLFKKNIHLIHSLTDSLVSFEPDVLSKIKNKYLVDGGHLSFSSKKYDDTFFDILYDII